LQEGNYDKTYFLEPGEGGAKAYALLRRAMEETGRIAIARIVIRSKESLAAIRVFKNGVLAMETMHFPDEVRSPAGLTGIVEPELRPQELEMATNLIASLSGDFEPTMFQNEYRQALLDMIAAKVAGEEVVQVEQAPERGRVVDLMDALRASIRLAETARGAEPGAAPPPDMAAAPTVPGAPAFPGAPGVAVRPDLGPATREGAPLPGAPTLATPAAPAIPGAPLVPGAPAVPPPAFLPPEGTR
jgi:DNA end-binding protein Ku